MPVDPQRTLTLHPEPARVLAVVAGCVGALVLLHAAAVAAGLRRHDDAYAYRFVHLDSEVSVGTWFAQALWLAVALVAGTIAAAVRRAGERWWRHWAGICALAVYLSIDEGAALHEQTSRVVRRLTGLSGDLFGPAWILVAAVVGLVLLAVYVRFLADLPRRTLVLLGAGAAVVVAGAAGAEVVNVLYAGARGTQSVGYHALAGMEEALEKLGVGILLAALLDHLRRRVAPVALVVER